MRERQVSIAMDEMVLLADIAASLRILAGRPPLEITDTVATIPGDELPAEETPVEVTPAEEPKPPVKKAGRKPKAKTGEGGA